MVSPAILIRGEIATQQSSIDLSVTGTMIVLSNQPHDGQNHDDQTIDRVISETTHQKQI